MSYHLLEKHFLRLKRWFVATSTPAPARTEGGVTPARGGHRAWPGCAAVSVGDPASAAIVVVLLHGFAMEPANLFAVRALDGRTGLVPVPRGAAAGRAARPRLVAIDVELRAPARCFSGGPALRAGSHPPDLPAARARFGAFLDAAWPPSLAGRPAGGRRLLDRAA